jgi:tight adherence protein C
MDAGRLVALQFTLVLTCGTLVFVARLVSAEQFPRALVTALAAAGIAFLLPLMWISMKASSRQDKIRKELPDMLDMLLISVEAGLGFDAAVAKIVMRTSGPIGEEFGRMLQDSQAGLSRREALRGLADRNNVPELNAFIMAMVQADVFGISVSNILRAQSRELRVKRRQRAQEMAQKAPAKMVFPLILCVLPATLIVLMGPAVISIGRAFGTL